MQKMHQPELIRWWPFNGSSEESANPNSAQKTEVKSSRFDAQEKGGVTFQQDGYIGIPHSKDLENQTFTIEAWVRPDGPGSKDDPLGNVILYAPTTGINIALGLWWEAKQNKFLFSVGNAWQGPSEPVTELSDKTLVSEEAPKGRYHHVVATYDPEEGMKLYLNGGIPKENDWKLPIPYNAQSWFIGGMPPMHRDNKRTWQGEIGTIRLYRGALPLEKIKQLYDACKDDIWIDRKLLTHLLQTQPDASTAMVPLKAVASRLNDNDASLLAVDLYARQIGDEGVKKLVEALKNNTTIMSLDLGENGISDPGKQPLLEALQANTSIIAINFETHKEPSTSTEDSLATKAVGSVGAKVISGLIILAGIPLMIPVMGLLPVAAGGVVAVMVMRSLRRGRTKLNPAAGANREKIEEFLQCNKAYYNVLTHESKEHELKIFDTVVDPVSIDTAKVKIVSLEEQLQHLRQDSARPPSLNKLPPDADEKKSDEEKLTTLSPSVSSSSSTGISISSIIKRKPDFNKNKIPHLTLEEKKQIKTCLDESDKTLQALTTPDQQRPMTQQKHEQEQKNVARMEVRLRLLRTKRRLLEEEIHELNNQPQNFLTAKREQIRNKLQPLLDYCIDEEAQLEQQQWISQWSATDLFYNYMKTKLNQVFLRWMAGVVDQDITYHAINILGKGLDIVSLGLASIATDGINAIRDRRRVMIITGVIDNFPTLAATESLAERVARNLTIRFAEQIKNDEITLCSEEKSKLSKWRRFSIWLGMTRDLGGVQTLAESAIRRMLEGLLSADKDGIDRTNLHQELVKIVLNSTAKLGFLGLINTRIPTKQPRPDHPFTDQGIFRRSDTRTETQLFGSRPKKYVSHLGTEDEATKLGQTLKGEKPPQTDIPASFFPQLRSSAKASPSVQQPSVGSDEKENSSSTNKKTF